MSKNILITGSTDGIGKLAAIKLAKEEHTIFVHGRNKEKLEKVIEEIKTASKNENISGFVADFSDLKAVQQMALEIKESIGKIDVLINNAGVFKSSKTNNEAGFDLRFVVNYFAPYVLTNELISVLEKGENPRLINLSSAAQSPVNYDALNGKIDLGEQMTYAQSKLALTMWSFDLAKKLKNINVIAVNPGSLLNTRMVQEAYGRFWSSADKGANILYELAISEKHEGITGKYFDNDNGAYGNAHPSAYDEKAISKLIEATEKIIA